MNGAKTSSRRAGAATPSFSTSAGRANFARALETTDREKTVVGFDRYNRPVAALVPIEAVAMLAGQGGEIDPAVRTRIVRMAKLFLSAMPARRKSGRRAAPSPRTKAKTAKKKKVAKRAKSKPKSRGRAKSVRRKTGLGNGA